MVPVSDPHRWAWPVLLSGCATTALVGPLGGAAAAAPGVPAGLVAGGLALLVGPRAVVAGIGVAWVGTTLALLIAVEAYGDAVVLGLAHTLGVVVAASLLTDVWRRSPALKESSDLRRIPFLWWPIPHVAIHLEYMVGPPPDPAKVTPLHVVPN